LNHIKQRKSTIENLLNKNNTTEENQVSNNESFKTNTIPLENNESHTQFDTDRQVEDLLKDDSQSEQVNPTFQTN